MVKDSRFIMYVLKFSNQETAHSVPFVYTRVAKTHSRQTAYSFANVRPHVVNATHYILEEGR